ncbi:MAG: hypothetical protein LBB76_13100 [Azoarcus sp.]|nr:hypothetical protein [Azoarcus sp.]
MEDLPHYALAVCCLFANVGLNSDTAVFAVESIRKRWYAEGEKEYGLAEKIVLAADCGGRNGHRNGLWKFELQKLANEIHQGRQRRPTVYGRI